MNLQLSLINQSVKQSLKVNSLFILSYRNKKKLTRFKQIMFKTECLLRGRSIDWSTKHQRKLLLPGSRFSIYDLEQFHVNDGTVLQDGSEGCLEIIYK